jgi:tripartite motif-containing protein 71
MRIYQVIVFALGLLVARMSEWPPTNVSWSENLEYETSEHLSFVRQFSSAQDVKREHPVVNRALDVVAGPKDPQLPIEALQQPYSVTTDSNHRIFITDVRAGAVHVFDFAHSKYSLLRGGDRLRSPLGVAADQEGNVYVSDSGLHTILVFDATGKFKHYLKSRGRESYFDSPQGIAVDAATQHIYVCDTARHMLIVLDKKGHVLTRFGIRGGGTRPGEFSYPTQVVVAGTEIAVLDSGNSRAQILDARGHFLKQIRLPGIGNRAGLAMDNDRNIYVSDPGLNRLRVFNHDGKLVYEFGRKGTEPAQFNGISGIWVDSGHCLYVVDSQNKRVQVFQITAPNAPGC